MNEDQTSSKPEKGSKLDSEFEFESVYANNTRCELSVWDLKVLFGELMQHTGKESVEWHTAVTLPWMQVKILIYYLRVNLALHEFMCGPLNVHPNVMPPKPTPPTPELLAEHPKAQDAYESACRIHSEMFD